MISPWEIYLVMQLDSVIAGLAALSTTALVLLCIYSTCMSIEKGADAFRATWFKKAVISIIASASLAVILPSSKTAAAMIVIPAVVNNKQVQDEAGDLYRLAKQGLQELVAEKSDSKPDPE